MKKRARLTIIFTLILNVALLLGRHRSPLLLPDGLQLLAGVVDRVAGRVVGVTVLEHELHVRVDVRRLVVVPVGEVRSDRSEVHGALDDFRVVREAERDVVYGRGGRRREGNEASARAATSRIERKRRSERKRRTDGVLERVAELVVGLLAEEVVEGLFDVLHLLVALLPSTSALPSGRSSTEGGIPGVLRRSGRSDFSLLPSVVVRIATRGGAVHWSSVGLRREERRRRDRERQRRRDNGRAIA
jgi:hypothetical protein